MYLWKCTFFAWLAAIAVFSLMPHPPVPDQGLLAWDKLQHAGAYGVLTLLGGMSFTFYGRSFRTRFLYAGILAVLLGGVMEVAQWLFTVNRTAEAGDLLADAVGAVVTSGVVTVAISLRGSGTWHRFKAPSSEK